MAIPKARKAQLRQAIRAHLDLGGGAWSEISRQFPDVSRRTIWRSISAVRAEIAASMIDASPQDGDGREDVAEVLRAFHGMGRRMIEQRGLLADIPGPEAANMAAELVRLRLEMVDLGIRVQRLIRAPASLQRLFDAVVEETQTLTAASRSRLYGIMQDVAANADWRWTSPQGAGKP